MIKKQIANTLVMIFGGTGNLTKRKLIPALYYLFEKKILKDILIVCVARQPLNKEQFIDALKIQEFIPDAIEEELNSFKRSIHYLSFDLTSEKHEDFAKAISRLKEQHKTENELFYLAIPPSVFKPAIDVIGSKIPKGKGWRRIIFEKPFGHDLASARAIDEEIGNAFQEEDIYRMDHYLGKELVQNILVLRFANSIFEQVWNSKFIDHVQIIIAEKTGVGTRSGFYDNTGALRDMVQNHILQILSLIAMEQPKSMGAEDIRDEKMKVIKSLVPLKADELVIGQYDSGIVDGREVPSYREELNVNKNSETETYVALKSHINNERWKGVPFYIRTGKRLKEHYADVNLVLKDVYCKSFSQEKVCLPLPNILNIRIQPDEGIAIHFNAKTPGYGVKLRTVAMDFCHKCEFGFNTIEAYEKLLFEVMLGDNTSFARRDNIEANWEYIDPILDIIKNKKKNFPNYKAGSFGPEEANRLLLKDGRSWIEKKVKT